jgi:general secretion pathway protein H
MLLPRLPDLSASRLKSTARRLAGTISYVYDRAAASKLVYRLTIDLDKRQYYVSLLNTESRFEKTELTFAKETTLPDKVKFTEARTASQGVIKKGKAVIHFFPSGFSDLSVIHLKDGNDNEMTLMVHPLTGRVKIFEGYKDIETRASLLGVSDKWSPAALAGV